MRTKSVAIRITADIPECELSDLADFIAAALGSWGGSLHPDDAFFNSLQVSRVAVGRRTFLIENSKRGLIIKEQQ